MFDTLNNEPPTRPGPTDAGGRADEDWRISYLAAPRVLLVEAVGSYMADSVRSLAAAALTEAARHSCSNLLVDASVATGRFDTIQIYRCPQMLRDLGLPHRARIGVVFSKPHPDHRFFEIVCQNQSIQAAAFYDRAVALAWFADGLKKQGIS